MAVLSDQTFKLSRNLKIATSIALLFSLFSDQFCGSISIFGNDIPTALARFALAAIIVYHVVYLAWHARADVRAFFAKGGTIEATVLDAVEMAEVNLAKENIPADTPNLEDIMEQLDSPLQRRQARSLFKNRGNLEKAQKADSSTWIVAVVGHIWVPIGFSLLTFGLLIFPEIASKVGAMLVGVSAVVCE